MSTTTVRAHHTPHVTTSALAALGIAAALGVGAFVAERVLSDSSSGAPARVLPVEPAVEVPANVEWQVGSPDALERSLGNRGHAHGGDPRYFGSPDAAERILSR